MRRTVPARLDDAGSDPQVGLLGRRPRPRPRLSRAQLEGRRARLVRELNESLAAAVPPNDRIVRLTRELADTELQLADAGGELPRVGFGPLLGSPTR